MLLLQTKMAFFRDIHAFLHLIGRGPSGANSAYLHFENYDLQDVFFQTLTQFSQGNKVLDAPPYNTSVSST
jgi:hypothetical protein